MILKRKVQYQLLESMFGEDLLQIAETFNANSFVQKNLDMKLIVDRKIVMFVHSNKY